MERTRMLELALQSLQQQKSAIEAEIEALRAELEGAGSKIRQTKSLSLAGPKGRRKRTAAEKKAQSKRMRAIWIARKAKAAKPAV